MLHFRVIPTANPTAKQINFFLTLKPNVNLHRFIYSISLINSMRSEQIIKFLYNANIELEERSQSYINSY